MNHTQPDQPVRISVVIPAYNKERWLGRAIDSVLSQERPADEILVVDDGSTDRTEQVAAGYGGKIRYIRQENSGPSAARNAGIAAAAGSWIAFLDADDQWLPEKLKLQTLHLNRHPNLAWTTGNYTECLCQSEYKAPALSGDQCKKTLGGGEILENYLQTYAAGFTGHTDTMLIRRGLLEEVGGFPAGQHRFEDLDLWLKIAYRQPRIGFLADPLAIHHMEAGEHISVVCEGGRVGADLIGRHLKLAAEHGRLEAFEPLAVFLLRRWMRGMLFDPRQANQIRRILTEFSGLLPDTVRWQYYLLTVFPAVTAAGCHAVSKIVRLLHLRRRAVRKPGPSGS
jgi:glycosyltransferase involved in cell wall biosynthesis